MLCFACSGSDSWEYSFEKEVATLPNETPPPSYNSMADWSHGDAPANGGSLDQGDKSNEPKTAAVPISKAVRFDSFNDSFDSSSSPPKSASRGQLNIQGIYLLSVGDGSCNFSRQVQFLDCNSEKVAIKNMTPKVSF